MDKSSQTDKQKPKSDPAGDRHQGVGHAGERNADSTVVNVDHGGLGADGDKGRRRHPNRSKPEGK